MSDASTVAWNKPMIAHRVVQIGLLVTLVWKWHFFWIASRLYRAIRISDPFFPDWLESVNTLWVAFVLGVAAIVLNLFANASWMRKTLAWITLLCMTVLCIHQGSYNDMTFVTAWWTSLWSVWFVHRMGTTDPEHLMDRATFLSRLIISVILLGGAVGKWTPEYWSGQVFYDIYFIDRDYWIFNLLRERFDSDTLREVAKWYSRQVVVVETIAGVGLWALPSRWAALVGVVLLTSIIVFSNYYLVSVLACLIGLASIGFLAPKHRSKKFASTESSP